MFKYALDPKDLGVKNVHKWGLFFLIFSRFLECSRMLQIKPPEPNSQDPSKRDFTRQSLLFVRCGHLTTGLARHLFKLMD